MDERSSGEPRARRADQARVFRRRRAAAVGAFAVIVVVVASSLNGSAPVGGPPAPHAEAAPVAPVASPSALAAQAAVDDKAVDDVLAYTPYIKAGSRRRKVIALTFDDGPGPTTPALVRYLKATGVPATFFLVGSAIATHPDVVAQQVRDGFALGAHTENHARLASRTVGDQIQEIVPAADRIKQISGHPPRIFRPPYGSFDTNTFSVLRGARMLMALWSIDTRDYSASGPDTVVSSVLRGARPGSVVLMHDGPGPRPHTLTAVRKIVPALRRRGFRIVTLPWLLRTNPPPRGQRVPSSLAG